MVRNGEMGVGIRLWNNGSRIGWKRGLVLGCGRIGIWVKIGWVRRWRGMMQIERNWKRI